MVLARAGCLKWLNVSPDNPIFGKKRGVVPLSGKKWGVVPLFGKKWGVVPVVILPGQLDWLAVATCKCGLIDWLKSCVQGKSVVCRYLAEHHKAYLTGGDARCRDALDGFNIVDYDSGIILFHYARNQSEHFCWEAMETFKDGSRKNHSRMKRWGRVHVLVFSNSFPDPEGKLTPDRLVIHDLASEPSFV
jgi:hypothetical protein